MGGIEEALHETRAVQSVCIPCPVAYMVKYKYIIRSFCLLMCTSCREWVGGVQIRGWADDYALQKVLVPIERALPEGTPQGRRTSARMSFLGSPGSPLPGSLDASLERRVAKVVAACGACAARIKDLEAAVKA